jgi:N-methylhydantoinase A
LLEPGHKIFGPAIVEQMDTTTVIQPEQEAMVDEYGNIIIKEKQA